MEYLIPLLSIVGGWWGSYLGSYFKQKSENLATHEDFKRLPSQMEATTSATKAIEARISNDVWGFQKQWEMRRDALLVALQALEDTDDAMMNMALAREMIRAGGTSEA